MFERTKGKSFRFSSVSSVVELKPDFPTGSNPKVPAQTGPATLVLTIFTLFKKGTGIHPGLVSSGIVAGTEKKETHFVRTLPTPKICVVLGTALSWSASWRPWLGRRRIWPRGWTSSGTSSRPPQMIKTGTGTGK